MARQSKVRGQHETEVHDAFRAGITYALDRVILMELGGKWTATLHMARHEELMRLVDEHRFTSSRKLRMLEERRRLSKLAPMTDKVGA
jgi:hypothetical protein